MSTAPRFHPQALPFELLEAILEAVGAEADLQSLSLTCSAFRITITSDHLPRIVVVSLYDYEYFERVVQNPALAYPVRELVILDDPLALPYEFSYGRRRDRRCEEHEATQMRIKLDNSAVRMIELAVGKMRRLRRFSLLAASRQTAQTSPSLDAFLAAICTNVPAVTEIHADVSPRWAKCNFPTFCTNARDMRVLDVGAEWHMFSVADWPAFCDLLACSPGLETLTIPNFFDREASAMPDAPVPRIPLPPLPYLKYLCVQAFSGQGIITRILEFLDDHPSLEEIRWHPCLIRGYPCPRLPPRLRSICDKSGASNTFLKLLLKSVPRASLHVEKLECGVESTGLSSFTAFDPTSLRVLRLWSLDSFTTLTELAKMFPDIEELFLPPNGTNQRLPVGFPTRVWRAARSLSNKRIAHLPSVNAVCALFPHLRVLSGTAFGARASFGLPRCETPRYAAKAAPSTDARNKLLKKFARVRKRWPWLEELDGWGVQEEGDPVWFFDSSTRLHRGTSPEAIICNTLSCTVVSLYAPLLFPPSTVPSTPYFDFPRLPAHCIELPDMATLPLYMLIGTFSIVKLMFEAVESRNDLLSLSTTCSAFLDAIIPNYLPRTATVSLYDRQYFENIIRNPALACRIRELVILDDPLAQSYEYPYGYRRDRGREESEAAKMRDELEGAAIKTIELAVGTMRRLRRFSLLAQSRQATQGHLHLDDLLAAVCAKVPTVAEIHADVGPHWVKHSFSKLVIPSFLKNDGFVLPDIMLPRVPLPPLPHLRHFSIELLSDRGIIARMLEFLDGHPSLEETGPYPLVSQHAYGAPGAGLPANAGRICRL
ncbi:hypothetical protein K488DRAFT_72539 [Vararia minispora EC-137]|uniref:Uncharacterized protein n=1 Tax=Vararia minispora EC-137 TaxID=1314806 RepID=A0ACB8QDV7_9AGAM|nr:hypothetical protein K488DRAFT_72539 [Vararia minispora EC-137]